jgi:hypothetical protein
VEPLAWLNSAAISCLAKMMLASLVVELFMILSNCVLL